MSRPSHVLGWLVCVASVVIVVGSRPAHAKAKIAVVVRGAGAGSDKAAGFVSYYVEETLAQDPRFEVVDIADVLGNPSLARSKKAFATAEELIGKGRTAYDTLDLDPAVEFLNTALSKYERNAADVVDFKKVADVLMLLGATHILRGDEKTGAKRLGQAIAIIPDIEPDPRIFNPGMRRVFQSAMDRLNTRPPGSISITSNPSYAHVHLDGKFVGVTPTSVDKVGEGRHYLRLIKPGYASWGRVVDVVAKVDVAEVATLKPADNYEEFDSLVEAAMPSLPNKQTGDSVGEVFRRMGGMLAAEKLFFSEVRLDGERVRLLLVLVDVGKAEVIKSATQTFSFDTRPETYRSEVGDLLKSQFSEESLNTTAAPVVPVDPSKLYASGAECLGMPCTKLRGVMLAVGLGGGALLGGLGGVFDFLAIRDNRTFRETPQTDPLAKNLQRSGKTKAILGDVLVGLGAATAITGLGIFIFWDPVQTPKEVASQSGGNWQLSLDPRPDGLGFSAAWRY